ncbi:maleate cis-trans isomerase family protein [Roseococcus pinisoli]|uniref:Aspartate/glutamate racemase family protein n=1 Tax=Roseococcus pinisoli TaxID=2835040 RepID=A0ABS5QIL6_9PROT|nr:aspartate/glutamate racemase family protein [Roseococcus pinisoli]MBS7813486.1 aspartate/glutamate racemase family protein [Roseococcus pinisoli]
MRLGFLTPSSNTVLEPAIAALLRDHPEITAHFARFRVTAINLGEASRGQFDTGPILAAAELLADAKVAAICWAGTSGSWLGVTQDEALCAAITARTGIPATTATLALHEALRAAGARRVALVTPYLAEVQAAIVANLEGAGLTVTAERHLEDPGNYSFALHAAETVDTLVEAAVAEAPTEAVIIHCTNFRGLPGAVALEERLGPLILDSVAVSVWGALGAAGARAGLPGGRLFRLAGQLDDGAR